MLNNLNAFLSALLSPKPRTRIEACWVCRRPVEVPLDDVWATAHQDTLGGAWTFDACEECRRHRGSCAEQVAYLAVLSQTDDAGLSSVDEQVSDGGLSSMLMSALRACDADGKRCGMPVHVWHDGRYFTVIDWLKTDEHKRHLAFVYPQVRRQGASS